MNRFLRQQLYRGNTALLHSSFCLAALSQTGLSFIVADGKTQTSCSIMELMVQLLNLPACYDRMSQFFVFYHLHWVISIGLLCMRRKSCCPPPAEKPNFHANVYLHPNGGS